MLPIARKNVEELCRKIADRSLRDHECSYLFVTLREEFPVRWPGTADAAKGAPSLLRDLGNSMAHGQREHGFISSYLRDFADRWLVEASKEGARSIVIEPVYPLDDLYLELFNKLDDLGIDHDEPAMRAAEYHLVTRIGWALDRRRVMLDKHDARNFCTFVGDVNADSRIAQPACVFNSLLVEHEDWGEEDEPALFGIPSGNHSHFAVPLIKDFVGLLPQW